MIASAPLVVAVKRDAATGRADSRCEAVTYAGCFPGCGRSHRSNDQRPPPVQRYRGNELLADEGLGYARSLVRRAGARRRSCATRCYGRDRGVANFGTGGTRRPTAR